jgi:hypothetical protein
MYHEPSAGGWHCLFCAFAAPTPTAVVFHLSRVNWHRGDGGASGGGNLNCLQCDYVAPSKVALRVHKHRKHKPQK